MLSSEAERRLFPSKIHIVYASQTGQAESISEYIFDHFGKSDGVLRAILEKLGPDQVQRHCVEQYEEQLTHFWEPPDKDQLGPGAYLLVLVASTTGQGDPPDKALRFFRWLRRLKRSGKPSLRHISYALLGLGDTNYDNFANFSKQVKKIFDELGATPYVTPEFADDAVGLELVTEPFIENLIETILDHFYQKPSETNNLVTVVDGESGKPTTDHSVIEVNTPNSGTIEKTDTSTQIESKPLPNESGKVSKKNINEITSVKTDISETIQSATTSTESVVTSNINKPIQSITPSIESVEKSDINKSIQSVTSLTESVEKSGINNSNQGETLSSESEKEDEEDDDMNITRPVVSACRALSGTDKRNLSELCRELVEPSENLFTIPDDQLQLPKVLGDDLNECFIYNKRQVENELKQVKICPIRDFLQGKVPNKSPLYEGEVVLSKLLSKVNLESGECCHKDKIVLECEAKYRDQMMPDESGKQSNPNEFFPGDSFGFFTANMLSDVYMVVRMVTVKHLDGEDDPILLWHYFKGNKKQVYCLTNKVTAIELLPYLVYGVDLRTVPKKAALCHLAKYTSDKMQCRRLLELSSRQGADEYQKVILAHGVTFIDLFSLFDTCHPPINVFLSYLISSRPRYFSSASVPIPNPLAQEEHSFKIVLSVMNKLTHTFMRTSEGLLGLFSGKFFKHYDFFTSTYYTNLACTDLWKQIETIHEYQRKGQLCNDHDVSLFSKISFPAFIFPRANKLFQLVELDKPMVLIATGTGIAPFMSVFDYRQKMISQNPNFKSGPITVFYGCRHPARDFTYGQELIAMAKDSSLAHLCLCFSRCTKASADRFSENANLSLCHGESGEEMPKHVDQLIRLHGEELVKQLANQEAMVYVCGNYKQISQTILKAFLDIFARYLFGNGEDTGIPSSEAARFLKELQQKKRFLQDVW